MIAVSGYGTFSRNADAIMELIRLTKVQLMVFMSVYLFYAHEIIQSLDFTSTACDPQWWKVTELDQKRVAVHMKECAPSIWAGGFENDGVLRTMVAVELKMKQNYLQCLAVCLYIPKTRGITSLKISNNSL